MNESSNEPAMTPRDWLLTAAAAALYGALTIAAAPLSYGPVQVRFSECMVLLAYYHKKWVPGLIAGCFLANLASPFGIADLLCGTAATAIAVAAMRRCPTPWTASLCPAIANGVIIALELAWLTDMPMTAEVLLPLMGWIGAGELLSVTVIGTGLFRLLLKSEVLRTYITK